MCSLRVPTLNFGTLDNFCIIFPPSFALNRLFHLSDVGQNLKNRKREFQSLRHCLVFFHFSPDFEWIRTNSTSFSFQILYSMIALKSHNIQSWSMNIQPKNFDHGWIIVSSRMFEQCYSQVFDVLLCPRHLFYVLRSVWIKNIGSILFWKP